MKRFGWLILFCLILFGCQSGPDYHPPTVPSAERWLNQEPTLESIADIPWWNFFDEPLLSQLISESISNNYDIQIATSRIEQAAGAYRIQYSDLFPSIDGTASWTRGRTLSLGRIPAATANQFDISALLSYEIDIWGKIRRSNEAALANLLAAEEGRRTVYISLVANVASAYFDLLGLDEQLEISNRTVLSRQQSLELTKIKFNRGQGIVSELDVHQAETLLYGAQATQADVERLISLRENELNLLLGRNSTNIHRGTTIRKEFGKRIPAGLPSDLLLRRPDILQAEQELREANANIGVARAAYFPSISLTGALGLQSTDLNNLFDPGISRVWRFTPQLVGPIFNAGRIAGSVQIAEGQQKEALAVYRRSIQNAFREVEDALSSIHHLQDEIEFQLKNVEAQRASLELSELRYQAGIASYSDVLDAQRFLFSAELTLAGLKSNRLISVVQLYRTLGGGWS